MNKYIDKNYDLSDQPNPFLLAKNYSFKPFDGYKLFELSDKVIEQLSYIDKKTILDYNNSSHFTYEINKDTPYYTVREEFINSSKAKLETMVNNPAFQPFSKFIIDNYNFSFIKVEEELKTHYFETILNTIDKDHRLLKSGNNSPY